LLLSACGGSSSGSGGSAGNSSAAGGGKVKLVWWHNANQEPGLSFYKKIADEYTAAHPNVTIEQVPLQSEDMKAKLQVAMQSPTPPDLIHQWGGGWMKDQVEAGKLKDLTADTKDLVPQLAGNTGWQLDGKVYGLNFTLGVVGFWYRKDLFTKAGITATPTTLEELLQDATKLRAAGVEPVAVGAKDKWPTAFWYDYLAVRECSKETLANEVKDTQFKDPCWTKAAEDFQKIVDAKPFAKGFLATSAQQGAGSSAGQLANGKAAMELMGQWNPGVIQGLTPGSTATVPKPLSPDVLGWFPFPSVAGAAGTQDGGMGGGDGYSCSVKAPKECVDFLKFFTSADVQKRYAVATSQLPANKEATSAITDPNLKLVLDARDKSSFVQLYLDVAFGNDVGSALNDAVSLQLAGSSKPDQVVKALQEAAASK
jgi:raffinose/stachyose/melibiose transport system substrate-binding protein